MANRICVVHYPNQQKYSNIKDISDINKEKITAAKEKRSRIGGDHLHKKQCDTIPNEFLDVHGVHLDPCYKR